MRSLSSLFAIALASAPALATEVGVSVEVGEPGFYGRIDIGNAPPPLLIYSEPVLIIDSVSVGPPIYLRVPPGHARHWRDHCAAYGACGRPVYFVQDSWYQNTYVPHYRKHHGKGKGKGNKGKGKGHN